MERIKTEKGIGLTDHCVTRLNRECVDVYATDEPAEDGAHHNYRIEVRQFEQPKNADPLLTVDLPFQNGGLAEVGANGITEQALLAIVLDRMRSFNAGPYGCRENSIAITKIEEALMWTQRRADGRAQRGVEGQRVK